MNLKFFPNRLPKARLQWQCLKSNTKHVPDAYRCAIEGGWLVRQGEALLFIPDPHHEWDGNSYSFDE